MTCSSASSKGVSSRGSAVKSALTIIETAASDHGLSAEDIVSLITVCTANKLREFHLIYWSIFVLNYSGVFYFVQYGSGMLPVTMRHVMFPVHIPWTLTIWLKDKRRAEFQTLTVQSHVNVSVSLKLPKENHIHNRITLQYLLEL